MLGILLILIVIIVFLFLLFSGGKTSPNPSPVTIYQTPQETNQEEEYIKAIIPLLVTWEKNTQKSEESLKETSQKQAIKQTIQILKSKSLNNDQKILSLKELTNQFVECEPKDDYLIDIITATANYQQLLKLLDQWKAYWNNYWQNIDYYFATETRQIWIEKGFSKEEVKAWVDIGFTLEESKFCLWLKEVKKKSPEWVLNHGNVEELKVEFENYEHS